MNALCLCLTLLLAFEDVVLCTTFTFLNNCDFTVWPGILSGAGRPGLETTGFELVASRSRTVSAPSGWSGRFWGRSECDFDSKGRGLCTTGDCGSGQVECNGGGAAPPVTLVEFTLGKGSSMDFYDVSLVDGYNLPMIVEGTGGSGTCVSTGFMTDLNRKCPEELRVGGGVACKSACEAFGSPEYCCSGEFNSPSSCKPSLYSQIFKAACPRSYSYAYDDPTSTFTCTGADYTITFCPNSPSTKYARGSTSSPVTPRKDNPGLLLSGTDPATPVQQTSYAASWLANLAFSNSRRNRDNSLPRIQFHDHFLPSRVIQAAFVKTFVCLRPLASNEAQAIFVSC